MSSSTPVAHCPDVAGKMKPRAVARDDVVPGELIERVCAQDIQIVSHRESPRLEHVTLWTPVNMNTGEYPAPNYVHLVPISNRDYYC